MMTFDKDFINYDKKTHIKLKVIYKEILFIANK